MEYSYTCLNCPMCSPPLPNIIKECNMNEADIFYSSWCDKIGGKIWWYSSGGCEDMYNVPNRYNPKQKYTKKKYKLDRYTKKQIDKRKLKKLYDLTWWAVGKTETHMYRCYKGKRSAYMKKQSNKKIRHSKDIPMKGNGFHKVYDYWWELW